MIYPQFSFWILAKCSREFACNFRQLSNLVPGGSARTASGTKVVFVFSQQVPIHSRFVTLLWQTVHEHRLKSVIHLRRVATPALTARRSHCSTQMSQYWQVQQHMIFRPGMCLLFWQGSLAFHSRQQVAFNQLHLEYRLSLTSGRLNDLLTHLTAITWSHICKLKPSVSQSINYS